MLLKAGEIVESKAIKNFFFNVSKKISDEKINRKQLSEAEKVFKEFENIFSIKIIGGGFLDGPFVKNDPGKEIEEKLQNMKIKMNEKNEEIERKFDELLERVPDLAISHIDTQSE